MSARANTDRQDAAPSESRAGVPGRLLSDRGFRKSLFNDALAVLKQVELQSEEAAILLSSNPDQVEVQARMFRLIFLARHEERLNKSPGFHVLIRYRGRIRQWRLFLALPFFKPRIPATCFGMIATACHGTSRSR